ncbi:MAG: BatD family protein [Planctomycetes bacterium]|nr:BatD family protein [Planctomycetota bacterium]
MVPFPARRFSPARWLSLLAALLALGLLSPPAAAADGPPRVTARLERDQIFAGESVAYTVTVENTETPSPPDLSAFTEFDVEARGERSLNSRSVRIVNGRVSEDSRLGRAYIYRLTPHSAGDMRLPAPQAVIGGQAIAGPALSLRVVAPREQEIARLEIAADRAAVYPLQPFTVTLTVLIKDLPAPHADKSPVGVQQTPPALSFPWVESLPDGLTAVTDAAEWLSPLESPGEAGFSINGISTNQVFSLFGGGPSVYLPKARRIQRTTAGGQTAGYWEYAFARRFLSTRPGRFAFGPATLKGTFATGIEARSGRLAGEELFAVAPKLTVTVKPVPEEGRPESFTGAIGRFEFRADLAPRKAKVGDPLTLTLTLRGSGTLDAAAPPDLKRLPEVAGRFRLYEATQETKGDARVFTYSIRPMAAGTAPFPSIPLATFDVEQERYVELATAPLELEIAEADRMAGSDVVTSRAQTGAAAQALEQRTEGIFANLTDPSLVRDERVRPAAWLGALGGMAAVYVVAALLTARTRRLRGDPALLRRRGALDRARGRLRAAAAAGATADGAEQTRAAFCGLVADIRNLPEAGLTATEVREQMAALGAPADVVARVARVIDACDAARYGAGDAALRGLAGEPAELLETLARGLKARGVLR